VLRDDVDDFDCPESILARFGFDFVNETSNSEKEMSPNAILFLCTGNYYRSRYAEELFNHLAKVKGHSWRAFSRGAAERDLLIM
jgi:hypothetical protein